MMKMEPELRQEERPASREDELVEVAGGVAVFDTSQGNIFRYKLMAGATKLRIWLENTTTKRQWQTDDLGVKEFANADLVISMATFHDYVKCLNCCLDAPTASLDFSRDVHPSECDTSIMVLRLTLKLHTMVTTWTPTYTFTLKPIHLKPVDRLAAQVREQAEEIKDLRDQVDALTAKAEASRGRSVVYARGDLTKAAADGETLLWKRVECTAGEGEAFIRFLHDGSIELSKGVFVVSVTLQSLGSRCQSFELQVNGVPVLKCWDGEAEEYHQVTTLHHIVMANPSDKLSVVYRGAGNVTTPSSISIYELH